MKTMQAKYPGNCCDCGKPIERGQTIKFFGRGRAAHQDGIPVKTIDIERLAVMFRVNDPNLGHVSTLEAMNELGLAYTYGLFRGTPKRHKRELRRLREAIASALDRKARKTDNSPPY